MNNSATTYSRSPRRAAKRQNTKPQKRASKTNTDTRPSRFSDWLSSDQPALPGWKDVHAKEKKKKNRLRSPKKATLSAEQLSTQKFALYTFLAVLLMSLYVSHVFATQEALARLEEVRHQNLQLSLEYNQKKASFDNLVRPDQVYRRAKELGFTEGTAFGPPVLWKPEYTD